VTGAAADAGFVVPTPLEPGDCVAVVAPSGGHAAAHPTVYELGLERLRDLGVEPVASPTATADDAFLAAHPEARARDVEAAFRDPEVGAVVATIGGNDQIRLARHLDEGTLRDHPTRFLGLSDNTVLHAALASVGVVSWYGGHVMTDLAGSDGVPAYTRDGLARALFGEPSFDLEPASAFTDHNPEWSRPDFRGLEREWEPNPGWSWRGGDDRVTGRTWGGCLEVLGTLLAADRYVPTADPDAEDLVLLLETSEELPDVGAVNRLLLGLGERGLLARAAAVLVGRPMARSHAVDRPPTERAAYREAQYDAVAAVVADYNPAVPVVCGLDFGHTAPTAVPPLGVRATVDPGAETIRFG